jgi:hypothetical protein
MRGHEPLTHTVAHIPSVNSRPARVRVRVVEVAEHGDAFGSS